MLACVKFIVKLYGWLRRADVPHALRGTKNGHLQIECVRVHATGLAAALRDRASASYKPRT